MKTMNTNISHTSTIQAWMEDRPDNHRKLIDAYPYNSYSSLILIKQPEVIMLD
jgi:hypothetical protein